jgi:hypothetical protein
VHAGSPRNQVEMIVWPRLAPGVWLVVTSIDSSASIHFLRSAIILERYVDETSEYAS